MFILEKLNKTSSGILGRYFYSV